MHRVALASTSKAALRPSVAATTATNVPKIFARSRSTTRRKPPPPRYTQLKTINGASSYHELQGPSRGQNAARDKESTVQRDLQQLTQRETLRIKGYTVDELVDVLANNVTSWSESSHVHMRFASYGIARRAIKGLLSRFARVVENGELFDRIKLPPAYVERIAHDMSDGSKGTLDEHLSRLFFEWAANPAEQVLLKDIAPQQTLDQISHLFAAVDLSYPLNRSPFTRSTPKRKIIMHVGPTNSGKTHNALRALAAAESGLYAGPLRLLAHEIFDRLNKGQIVPAGMDPTSEPEADENTNIEVAGKPVIQKDGNPLFARECNLITGEEQRIVSPDAGLVSCTVEMMEQSVRRLDVAVIDEIQMIANPERGGAWTGALLGVNASEVHLCGEERAVPLIEALLKDTGDELIVNRYERLTPLQVADESLDGDFTKVRKGDCIVTFARSNIFKLKDIIESTTNLKCAVVYGALPPEIRSLQAASFNKSDGGYDVIIGSDAIGMGLNLKIKRVIFHMVRKWNGHSEELLELSAFKQIAGRAGRFVLHGPNVPGVVTTVNKQDLPILRKALELPIQPIKHAGINLNRENLESVVNILPVGTPLPVAMSAYKYATRIHPNYMLEDISKKEEQLRYIENVSQHSLTLDDRMIFILAPVAWRVPNAMRAFDVFMDMFRRDLSVDYHRMLTESGLQAQIDDVKDMMDGKRPKAVTESLMQGLEAAHKAMTLYLWMSFRQTLTFRNRNQATETIKEIERAMDWVLNQMSKSGRRSPAVARHERRRAGVGHVQPSVKSAHSGPYSWSVYGQGSAAAQPA